jgi:hypothetical protein
MPALAVLLLGATPSFAGDGVCGTKDAGDCCEANGTPGCNAAECCAAICAADAFCCETEWDQICADAANIECGDVCGGPPPKGSDCCVPHKSAGCDDSLCEMLVCTLDPFCCEVQWDELCAGEAEAECGDLCGGGGGAGDCCEPNGSPGCEDAACETAVCDADPFCCDTEWDQICADGAAKLCGKLCGGPPPTGCPGEGDCCEANGTPGCDDAACCEAVCVADAFCCDVEWDQICADSAAKLCGKLCGGPPPKGSDCCIANGSPGCDDAECEAVVCEADTFCCDTDWDQICADAAADLCGDLCGGPPPTGCPGEGDCCEANGTPGCNDEACCEAVCAADVFCCDVEWDQICADAAADLCGDLCEGGGGPCPGEGDCCEANGTPGCDSADCCEAVCAADPFCCDTEWDLVCADGAAELCVDLCDGGDDCPGDGDCCEANGTVGCDDTDCCTVVCEADPFCCEFEWDQICADGAAELCGDLCVEAGVDLDIKPGSCPNPFNNSNNGSGKLPVAITSVGNFDVTLIDIDSLELFRADGVGGSVAPLDGPPGPGIEVEDVATPYDGDAVCGCNEMGGDGTPDLTMKFSRPEMTNVLHLDDVESGASVELILSGSLADGTPFEVSDCIVIVP